MIFTLTIEKQLRFQQYKLFLNNLRFFTLCKFFINVLCFRQTNNNNGFYHSEIFTLFE